MALWRTPVVALMPDITPSPLRSQANGIINLMGGLGAIVATLGGSQLYKINPAYPFWLGSVLVVVASLLVFAFIREPKEIAAVEQSPGLLASLREVLNDTDRSALRLLLAIFFWFLGYTAIEAFFSLYAVNHLRVAAADGVRLLGQLSLIFVLFALPAGYIGARIGRRVTIVIGIAVLGSMMLGMFLLPVATLTTSLFYVPVLQDVPVAGLMLMFAGAGWALININSLPMVVDMTDTARIGTYTGLYYLFATLAAIAGPNVNGWLIQLSGNNYNLVMIVAPLFMAVALVLMLGVRRGEARPPTVAAG
jgi:MFS family permease